MLGNESGLVDTARSLDIPVTIIELPKRSRRNPLGWWRSVRRLNKLIQDTRPHIVHANDVPSCQAMSVVAGRLGIPRVVHIRWGITARDMGWWACRGAERILCISRWIEGQLGRRVDTPIEDTQITVLPDAVDWPASRKNGQPQETETDEDTAQVRSPALTLGYAGQLIESKGLDLVIEAIGQLPQAMRPRLLIAGEDTQTGGGYRRQLEELAQRCGVQESVTWLGFVEDVSWLYRQVDAVVCPSRVEPLGLVPLEAARYRRPAIASRVGGLAETILNGQTGHLVDPTVEGWKAGLAQLGSRDELDELGQGAYERTLEHHSPERYQAALMTVYEELMGRESTPS